MNKIFKVIIKYISLAIVGAVLFAAASPVANASRSTESIGGEAFFLTLPLFWWLVDEMLKDFKRIFKHEQVSEENSRDSPTESESEQKK